MRSQKPNEKICLWASMIVVYVSVEICQFQFANFLNLEKDLLVVSLKILKLKKSQVYPPNSYQPWRADTRKRTDILGIVL